MKTRVLDVRPYFFGERVDSVGEKLGDWCADWRLP